MKLNLTCTYDILRNVKNVKLGEHNSKLWDIRLLLSLFSASGVCSGSSRCPCFLGDGTAMGQFSQGLWAVGVGEG